MQFLEDAVQTVDIFADLYSFTILIKYKNKLDNKYNIHNVYVKRFLINF